MASALDLRAEDGVVIHNSNRITMRLTPCDVLARVAPLTHHGDAELEIKVSQQLSDMDCPVERTEPRVEPRVYVSDGFVITFWTYYEAVPPQDIVPTEYAQTLEHYHASIRQIDLTASHFTDRVAEAQRLVSDHALTPELDDTGRQLLGNTLRGLKRAIIDRGAPEQLLHGEPHPGNLLNTKKGLLLIDLETCCRGPVEFDIAHAPEGVSKYYPDVNQSLLRECRVLVLAMVTAWRWDRDDQFPDGGYWGIEGINQIRVALDRYEMDFTD
jgi:hypothetical protein